MSYPTSLKIAVENSWSIRKSSPYSTAHKACTPSTECAHQGGPIAQGRLDGQCVTCPWHGWQYDITNGKNLLTGKQMLECFEVERRGDAVWVNIDKQ
ncbi:MAG: Rieske (2Fe-2S) protein [Pirellulaceae bacterium]